MVFAVFYWGVPAYEAYLANKGGMAATMAQFFADRSQRLGVLLLIVALVVTALQLIFGRPLTRREQRGASWLSRQLGRMIDD
jgi:drug/metabolite transporter (DMT)-like permease